MLNTRELWKIQSAWKRWKRFDFNSFSMNVCTFFFYFRSNRFIFCCYFHQHGQLVRINGFYFKLHSLYVNKTWQEFDLNKKKQQQKQHRRKKITLRSSTHVEICFFFLLATHIHNVEANPDSWHSHSTQINIKWN